MTDKFLDAVDLGTFDELGEQGLTITSSLVKARKVQVDPESEELHVQATDAGGVAIGEGLRDLIGEDSEVSVTVRSFDSNLFA